MPEVEAIELAGTQNLAIFLLVLLSIGASLFGYLFYRATVRPCAAKPGGLAPEKPKFS